MKPARTPLVSLEAWKAAQKAGQCPPVAVRQTFEIEQKEGDLSIVMSSATEDRMGDTINQAGWKLDAYKANPVLLWGHDSFSPPVGRVKAAVVEDGKLKAKGVEWVPKDVSPFAWSISEMVRLGFVKAVSVGFRPAKWSYNDAGGVNFEEQELLELSFVSVPANPEALVEAKSFDVGLVDRWAADLLLQNKEGVALDNAKAWLASRAPALQRAADVDDGPLPEFEALAEALREHTAALKENTAELRSFREAMVTKSVAQSARLPSVDTLVSLVRSKL